MPKESGVGARAGWWTGTAGRVGVPVLLAVVVTLGMLLIYWPLLRDPSDNKFYGYGDSWTYYGPTQFYGDYVAHQGEWPLWNPLILCGQPIAGNPQYATFYPPNILRRLLTVSPTPSRTHTGLAIMLYAHVLSAAWGVYALGRGLGLSRSGAFTAGVAFAFSAAFTQRIFGHLLVVMVVSWLPWCLCALRALLRAPTLRDAAPAAVALGVAFTMAILAGTPQMTLLVGFALLVYWAIERAIGLVNVYAGRETEERITGRRIGLDVLAGALAVTLAAGIAAPLLVPALEFFADTPRGTQFGEGFEKTVGDETFRVPELLAIYGGGANYEGLKTLSAAGLILALTGVFSARRREAWLLGAMAVLLIDASLERSWIMLRLLLAVSPFPISSPARGMMVAVLPLALLAGLGVDALREPGSKRRRAVIAGAAGALGVLLCFLIARRAPDVVPAMPVSVLLYPALTAAGVGLALLLRNRSWLPAAAVCVLIAEAVHWRGAYVRHLTTLDGIFFSESATGATPEFWRGNTRDIWPKPNRPLYDLTAQINGFDAMPLNGVISTMMPGDEGNRFWRAALPEWMAATGNRGYLLLKRGFWLHSHYVEGEAPAPGADFPPTTTVFLADPADVNVSRTRATEMRTLPYSADFAVIDALPSSVVFTAENLPTLQQPYRWTLQGPLPPQHKVLALHIQSDRSAVLKVHRERHTAAGPDFLPIGWVYLDPTGDRAAVFNVPLPDDAQLSLAFTLEIPSGQGSVSISRAEVLVDWADETDRIRVIARTANRVEVEVRDLPGPRILSAIDFMYPGWRAYLDGEEVPILRAYGFFKAVEVPEGTHRIVFRFRPPVLLQALTIWVFSLILCAALIRWARTVPPAN